MPVVFNCEFDQLVVPAQYLDQTIANANTAIQQLTQQYLRQFKKDNDNDVLQQVTTLIQQTMSIQDQSIEHIAGLLGLSKRTLQRRLKEKDIVFKELLNDIRIKTAKWYLTSSQVDITLLSEILGYSDVSGLSRAFKKETGIAPLAWRKTYGYLN
jgi:AraC-like DNA-binding protein